MQRPTRDSTGARSGAGAICRCAAAACALALAWAAPAGAQGAGTIAADDFNGSSLNTSVWTLADPLGDASVSVGGGTADVSLPSGTSHDVWGNTNTVSGLRQAAPDRDFEIEAKFASAVGTGFQQQGLIVEQDSNDLVRAEVHHDGGGTRLFVATMFNGNPEVRHYSAVPDGGPVYIRVVREGNTWRVRYSRDGSTWTTTAPFTLAIAVTKVGPLVGNGGAAFTGRIDSFREVLPDSTGPVITGLGAAARTLDATVTWTTDEPATSEVAYGPTTAYGSARIGGAGLATEHSVVIHGLACDRTYHFQVKSKDASNNSTPSADQTLTTAACPAAMESDEFNAASLDMSRWTLVDPGGGVTVGASGSQALINLPAGIQHDVWTGADTVARLLQPAPDDNFELRVKYDSIVDATYQSQGLVVEQDSNDLLRLEIHREGSSTRLFAASIENGAASVIQNPVDVPDGAPVYLRLLRSGDQWTFSYSQNGTTWLRTVNFTRAMDVTAAGLLAGNSGAIPPAFQARADWFRYTPPDRTAPVISGVAATPAAGAGARVTWTTDEPSSSEVAFGTTTGYGDGTIAAAGDATSHTVVLHSLRCDTTYHYRVRSVDPAGNAQSGPDHTVTTGPCPPFLGSDEFDGATLDTSKWAFVDPLGDSSQSLATGAAQLAVPAGTAHDLWSTVRTVPRLLQTAPDIDFEVLTKFDTAVGSTTQQQGIVVEETHRKLLRFETYYEGSNTHLFVAMIDGGTADIIHDSIVPSGGPLYLKLRRVGNRWTFSQSQDGEAWRSTSFERALDVTAVGPYVGNGGHNPAFQGRIDFFREVTDRMPPVISEVSARPVSRQAQVTWTTDEPASSTVEYREGTGDWQTASESVLQTRHSVVADGLQCDTTYSFRVRSADVLGNPTTSGTASFTTTPCTATSGPDIDLWNGTSQTFGQVGVPQTWVNVTGNVSDPDGVQSLKGRLNGSDWETLGIEPDGWRIVRPGDFNYEVNISELVPGDNFVELQATDADGRTTTQKVTVNWQGLSAGAAPPADGPVLVVAARPSDEARNFAGVIDSAKAAGRRVYVVLFTNGESSAVSEPGNYCNAPADAAAHAGYGLMRDREARDSMSVLGLTWSANLSQTELIYLGYPGRRVGDVASSDQGAVTNVQTGVQRTYAEDFDGDVATCDGDFRYLLDGTHSPFTAQAMRADLDALLAMTDPSDIYTHATFDGQGDQAEVGRQLRAAVRRANAPVRLHTALQHPEGEGDCQAMTAQRWPNPSLGLDGDPFARFTPALDLAAPPASPCDLADTTTSWGAMGAPNEHVEVPAAMQSTSEATNKKWQAIARHASLIDCSTPGNYHVSCGYMRAFVKKHEVFWRYDYGTKRVWPQAFTAQWTSNASISQSSQVLEGQWRYEGDGVRPLTTGFDRALIVGDTGWIDYDVRMPFTIHSFNPSSGQGAAVGLGVGWQGHNAWSQPRHGHPSGGLCLYARLGSEGAPYVLQIGYSPGPVDDTTLVTKDTSLAASVQYMMRFRQQDGFDLGKTRYSCKVWRADQAEPAAWDLQADIADWDGAGQRAGSAVLLAHEVDATFGDTTFTPLP